MAGEDWEAFRNGLARSLAVLPDGGALIVRDQQRTVCFVQFLFNYDHIRAEVASGWDLTHQPNLTPEEFAAIERIGWLSPVHDHTLNHGLNIAWPAPSAEYRRVADISVVTLRDVFLVPSPASLCYQSFISPGNRPLLMHSLGIPLQEGKSGR
ncbi:hypothetical protein ACWT_5726 [Actinoplanes sp. SE50]|uniref:TY-Chap domain-containing protein n=1 Tax=unclassified Actinoplanes TaxID=2626549 RepID=UPI00023ED4BA|nr:MULTISPECIES: hypothetical protein [unclassified Actinoplanes]AEV86744.1 hypothetical protein ACPL_5857 [Actinoplanes sp. SE50/110]ATO85141.1 hypothetical protein ACWT_5726 [Actinoplanes sp. SE50]SLM02552.1 uncharacterized protein ACSP50_5802 [Actinoplanes sp. SE50/110]